MVGRARASLNVLFTGPRFFLHSFIHWLHLLMFSQVTDATRLLLLFAWIPSFYTENGWAEFCSQYLISAAALEECKAKGFPFCFLMSLHHLSPLRNKCCFNFHALSCMLHVNIIYRIYMKRTTEEGTLTVWVCILSWNICLRGSIPTLLIQLSHLITIFFKMCSECMSSRKDFFFLINSLKYCHDI